MGELNRRVHVLLDDDRLERLRQRAEIEGSSVGALIRSAIDRELEAGSDMAVAAAVQAFLAAEPMPVGDPDEIKRVLSELNARNVP